MTDLQQFPGLTEREIMITNFNSLNIQIQALHQKVDNMVPGESAVCLERLRRLEEVEANIKEYKKDMDKRMQAVELQNGQVNTTGKNILTAIPIIVSVLALIVVII
jgi:hypothetical protein